MRKEKSRKAAGFLANILSGDFALALGLERQLGFIFYLFLLTCASIAWSLTVEQNMVQVQKNEKKIAELKISYQQNTLDIVGMNNRTKLDGMLAGCNSKLKAPTRPPRTIDTRQ